MAFFDSEIGKQVGSHVFSIRSQLFGHFLNSELILKTD